MYGGGPRGMGRRRRTTRKRGSPGFLTYLNPRVVLHLPSPRRHVRARAEAATDSTVRQSWLGCREFDGSLR